MTHQHNHVEELLNAYFDYLEGIGPKPTLDHLTEDERAEAERHIASLSAGRGIDPDASRPSVAALLARIDKARQSDREHAVEQILQSGLRESIDTDALVLPDVASIAAHFPSQYIVHARGLRIRVVVESEGIDIDASYADRVTSIAAVFGAFPDTNAVLITTTGIEPAGAVVDRDDVVTAIETPSGLARPPRIRRPVGDPVTVCAEYLKEVMPAFEPFEYLASGPAGGFQEMVDVDDAAATAIRDIVSSGQRARLEAKRVAWSKLTNSETAAVATALREALAGQLNEESYRRLIERTVEAA